MKEELAANESQQTRHQRNQRYRRKSMAEKLKYQNGKRRKSANENEGKINNNENRRSSNETYRSHRNQRMK